MTFKSDRYIQVTVMDMWSLMQVLLYIVMDVCYTTINRFTC